MWLTRGHLDPYLSGGLSLDGKNGCFQRFPGGGKPTALFLFASSTDTRTPSLNRIWIREWLFACFNGFAVWNISRHITMIVKEWLNKRERDRWIEGDWERYKAIWGSYRTKLQKAYRIKVLNSGIYTIKVNLIWMKIYPSHISPQYNFFLFFYLNFQGKIWHALDRICEIHHVLSVFLFSFLVFKFEYTNSAGSLYTKKNGMELNSVCQPCEKSIALSTNPGTQINCLLGACQLNPIR